VVGVVAAATGMLVARGRLYPPRGAPIPDPDDITALGGPPPPRGPGDRSTDR
jgi:hypothetical protein